MALLIREFNLTGFMCPKSQHFIFDYCFFSSCYIYLFIFFAESIEQMVMNMPAKNEISPTLRDIVCHLDEDNQRSSQTFNVDEKFDFRAEASDGNEADLDNNSFGNHEAWSFDHDEETSVVNESSSFDPPFHGHHEVFVPCCCYSGLSPSFFICYLLHVLYLQLPSSLVIPY